MKMNVRSDANVRNDGASPSKNCRSADGEGAVATQGHDGEGAVATQGQDGICPGCGKHYDVERFNDNESQKV